jgi:hypothetical protein
MARLFLDRPLVSKTRFEMALSILGGRDGGDHLGGSADIPHRFSVTIPAVLRNCVWLQSAAQTRGPSPISQLEEKMESGRSGGMVYIPVTSGYGVEGPTLGLKSRHSLTLSPLLLPLEFIGD